jgi:DNA-directed RNA polymerase subunit RPC12/RpoP
MPLTPPAVKADKLLIMLLHYRDVVKMSVLQECLAIQFQTGLRMGAILRDRAAVPQDHLMSGYRLVYQRFSICTQCAESSDLQNGPVAQCPHCGNKTWFKDSPDQIFAAALSPSPVAAPRPAPISAAVPKPAPSADPFNTPIGYQQATDDQGDFARLMATSHRQKRPNYEEKVRESTDFDLGLSMDELDIFQLEQMEAAQKAVDEATKAKKAKKAKKATAAKATKPAPAKKKPDPQKAPPPPLSGGIPKASAEINRSSEFGDWKKVQSFSAQGETLLASQSVAPVQQDPERIPTPVKAAKKKGCGKKAALFLIFLGSLAAPLIAYAF